MCLRFLGSIGLGAFWAPFSPWPRPSLIDARITPAPVSVSGKTVGLTVDTREVRPETQIKKQFYIRYLLHSLNFGNHRVLRLELLKRSTDHPVRGRSAIDALLWSVFLVLLMDLAHLDDSGFQAVLSPKYLGWIRERSILAALDVVFFERIELYELLLKLAASSRSAFPAIAIWISLRNIHLGGRSLTCKNFEALPAR